MLSQDALILSRPLMWICPTVKVSGSIRSFQGIQRTFGQSCLEPTRHLILFQIVKQIIFCLFQWHGYSQWYWWLPKYPCSSWVSLSLDASFFMFVDMLYLPTSKLYVRVVQVALQVDSMSCSKLFLLRNQAIVTRKLENNSQHRITKTYQITNINAF